MIVPKNMKVKCSQVKAHIPIYMMPHIINITIWFFYLRHMEKYDLMVWQETG